MQIYCRCSVGLQDLLKYIPVAVFWGKISTDFRINVHADFVLCIKLGVLLLSPQVSSWGCSSPQSTPGSYVAGMEAYVFTVDTVPIDRQDLKCILFMENAYKFSNNL